MTASICQPENTCAKHGVVKRTKRGRCKKCVSEQDKKWRVNNTEVYRKRLVFYSKNYIKKNREKRRQYESAYGEKNAARRRKYMIDYVKQNPYSTSIVKNTILKSKLCSQTGIKSREIPLELVELKRLQLKLLHAIKQREKLESVI